MNYKAPVYRTCIITRKKLLKEDLFRVVRVKDKVYLDLNQDMQGRGVYICKDLETIKLAHKRNALSRGLKINVEDSIYIELIQALSKERR